MNDYCPHHHQNYHASDCDRCGSPLTKIQAIKLNCSKSAPLEVLKLKCQARVAVTRNIDVAGGVVCDQIGLNIFYAPNGTIDVLEMMCITTLTCLIAQMLQYAVGWAITVH